MSELPLEVSCEQVKELLSADQKPLLIDCREPDEHAMVHLPDACLLPMQQIPSSLDKLQSAVEGSAGASLIVYCHHGMRSAQTANWLREHGFPQAQSMAGGIDAWAVEIDPTLARY